MAGVSDVAGTFQRPLGREGRESKGVHRVLQGNDTQFCASDPDEGGHTRSESGLRWSIEGRIPIEDRAVVYEYDLYHHEDHPISMNERSVVYD